MNSPIKQFLFLSLRGLLALALPLSALSVPHALHADASGAEAEQRDSIKKLTADFLRNKFSYNPFMGSTIGIPVEMEKSLGVEHCGSRLPDMSAEAYDRQVAFYKEFLERAEKFNPEDLTGQERIDLQMMMASAESYVHRTEICKEPQTDIFAVTGPYNSIMEEVMKTDQATERRELWLDLIERAEKIPAYLKQVQANLRKGIREGNLPGAGVTEEYGIASSMAAGQFFGGQFIQKGSSHLGGEDDWKELSPRLLAAGQAAQMAYAEIAQFLKQEVLPRANEGFALGEEEYAHRLRQELGIHETPARLRDRGLALAQDLEDRMQGLALKIRSQATGTSIEELAATGDPAKILSEVMVEMKEDHPANDEELFKEYRRVSTKAQKFVADKKLFDSANEQIKVVETPAGLRPWIAVAAYFPAPALDRSKKGTFLVTPTGNDKEKLKGHNRPFIESIVVHEAYPGHDLQFDAFQKANVPPVRNAADVGFGTSVNVEGYALYSEELMRQNGYFDDPRLELAQLQMQVWRAYRIVLDTSMHSGRMSMDEAAEILTNKVFLPEPIAKAEAFRYSIIPTQAVTYMVGRLQIEDIKRNYKAILGDDFEEAEFHRQFLSYGPALPTQIKPVILEHARELKARKDKERAAAAG